ncbi:hypothetical protein L1049_027653 [Liquidambar formosana]|uniref:Wall-associated receptor kinase galacturonan-binding domain-containing protein n=1 Tax=Liquidambar formosana TaxID=63359 RepID=A0AAP0WVQ2_LIQFO
MEPSAATPPMAMPGCKDSCGGVTIPYPFGFGEEHCYHEKAFEINCKVSANNTAKPFLTPFNLEVLRISLESQNVTVNVPVVPICRGSPWTSPNLTGSPFRFSDYNIFTVRGCGNALLTNQSGEIVGGCATTCDSSITTRGCYGINCCETHIPSGLAIYNITTTDTTTEKCTPSFLWYQDNYPIPAGNFSNIRSTPVLLDWMITSLHNLPPARSYPDQRCSAQSFVDGMRTYSCQCPYYNEGNPYISNGCQVVPACAGCIRSCAENSSTYTDIGKGIDLINITATRKKNR